MNEFFLNTNPQICFIEKILYMRVLLKNYEIDRRRCHVQMLTRSMKRSWSKYFDVGTEQKRSMKKIGLLSSPDSRASVDFFLKESNFGVTVIKYIK